MKNVLFMMVLLVAFQACKKDKVKLENTRWQTYYKYETFNFYAEKELVLNKDNTCFEFGSFDTVYGNWIIEEHQLKVNFKDNTIIKAKIINNNSLSGYKQSAAFVSGEWYAKRK